MKKLYLAALSIATVMSANIYSADMHGMIDQALENVPSILTQKTHSHLAQAGTSGLISYALGSYCMEVAKTFENAAEKKNGTKLGKSVAKTVALLLKTAGYTGQVYGSIALASIPFRYFLPVIYNTYVAGKYTAFGPNIE